MALGVTEESLELVRRSRDPRVTKALEEVLAVPRVAVLEAIDKTACCGTESRPWRVRDEVAQVSIEPSLSVRCR